MEYLWLEKRRATGRHKPSMNQVSLVQRDGVRICLQLTWCCPTNKSGISLQAFGNLLLRVSSCSLQSNTMALNKYPHTHSFSSSTFTVTSSLVSCRDCPGVANAACLLSVAEILASNASLGCNIPNTGSSLPSLRCREMQVCCLPVRVSPPGFYIMQFY